MEFLEQRCHYRKRHQTACSVGYDRAWALMKLGWNVHENDMSGRVATGVAISMVPNDLVGHVLRLLMIYGSHLALKRK